MFPQAWEKASERGVTSAPLEGLRLPGSGGLDGGLGAQGAEDSSLGVGAGVLAVMPGSVGIPCVLSKPGSAWELLRKLNQAYCLIKTVFVGGSPDT